MASVFQNTNTFLGVFQIIKDSPIQLCGGGNLVLNMSHQGNCSYKVVKRFWPNCAGIFRETIISTCWNLASWDTQLIGSVFGTHNRNFQGIWPAREETSVTNTLETRWDLSGCLQLSIFLLLLCLWTVVGRSWSVVEALCCKTTRGQFWSAETLLSQMAREVPRAWPGYTLGPQLDLRHQESETSLDHGAKVQLQHVTVKLLMRNCGTKVPWRWLHGQ